MKGQAYILISTAVDKTESVRDGLAKLPEVKTVQVVTGPYDVIALVEVENILQIGNVLLQKVRRIEGITHTLTCYVVG